jgi:hypothetical protein
MGTVPIPDPERVTLTNEQMLVLDAAARGRIIGLAEGGEAWIHGNGGERRELVTGRLAWLRQLGLVHAGPRVYSSGTADWLRWGPTEVGFAVLAEHDRGAR